MIKRLVILAFAFAALSGGGAAAQTVEAADAAADSPRLAPEIVVGSKTFTESVILGEMITQLARSAGAEARHRRELGGSTVLFKAVKGGDLDAYPEYTGTLIGELLVDQNIQDIDELSALLAEEGLAISEPIGFNNTYAIGVRKETAAELGLETISDLRDHPELRMAFSNEFMERADGWPGLRSAYNLPQQRVQGIAHDLGYRALVAGDISVTDVYTTDAEIAYYDLALLEDDLGYFPRYEAVVLYRTDLRERAPEVLEAILRLEGAVDAPDMRRMNELAKIGRTVEGDDAAPKQVPAAIIARDTVGELFSVTTDVHLEGRSSRLWRTTREQAYLVAASMALAILAAVPVGILAARIRKLSTVIMAAVGVCQTVPSLALLVLLIPIFGLTPETAIVALFLYSLLPIVRNTHAGITGVSPDLIESAEAIGLTGWQRLRHVELPIALPTILAGVKTAAVINVGTATLAALIGAGGYGQPILTGIRLDDHGLILEGAIPAAVMAIAAQLLFDGLERIIVSPGLRL